MNELIKAAMFNDVNKCVLLLQNGADVNARDEDGETALDIAARHGHTSICQIFAQHSVNKNN